MLLLPARQDLPPWQDQIALQAESGPLSISETVFPKFSFLAMNFVENVLTNICGADIMMVTVA